ncbi:SMI1/KNR4 family protein [Edaphobacter flagellatus]|uniref:SMI1/KNR4 family protein n=1 Tax=Edaphobacter flagellatus TaxID=1933044 RepID=UPI0021B218BE|nr:SMI1/KNR4 family protein [Edaphobacter flagellatus]
MSVASAAGRLFDLLTAQGTQFTQYLRPGLTPEQIREIAAPVEHPLPPEVVEFYRHYDLPKGYFYNPDQPTFYGIYWLLGLEDAVASWQERRSYDFLDAREHEWFPFIEEDGNNYLVDMVATPEGQHPIVRTFHGLEPHVEFANLTAMFDTFYAWVSEDVVPVESGHVAGDYEGDKKRVAEIAVRLNPGVAYWTSRLAQL